MIKPRIKIISIPYENNTVYVYCIKTEDGWGVNMSDEFMKVLENSEITINGTITVENYNEI
jgi:hypothetical protein